MDECRAATGNRDLVGHSLAVVVEQVGDDDRAALRGEPQGARPADFALLIQERGAKVLNASRRLAVIPKCFHEPTSEPAWDVSVGTSLMRELEEELFELLNETGIGPMGLGGDVTVLNCHVEHADTHMTLNPVAVNYQCWAARRASAHISAEGEVEFDREA